MSLLLVGLLVAGGAVAWAAGGVDSYALRISSLVDPAKLATLEARGANPRVEKYVALLAEGKADGVAPKKVAAKAVAVVGMKGKAAKLTAEAMVHNPRGKCQDRRAAGEPGAKASQGGAAWC